MLPKNRRIPRKDFLYILANGTKYNSPVLLLNVAKTPTSSEKSRFSFSVSKKVSKSAVLRNKFRRRGYSIIEKYINNLKSGYFLFFSYKKGVEKYKYTMLEKEIIELLKKSFMLE